MNPIHLAKYIKNHAETNPTGIAIKSFDNVLNYRELEEDSNRIANFLYEHVCRPAALDNNKNVNVSVILDRSAAIVTTILGILKAGIIFVPLSAQLPPTRLELLLKETKSRWVITSLEYYNRFREIFRGNLDWNIVLIDGIPGPDLPPAVHIIDDMYTPGKERLDFMMRYNKYCYIYFTSGSTGTPKGVLGKHKSLYHYIDWEITEFGINNQFQVSQLTPPTFDPYLRDIFVPLLAGGTLCIPDYDTLMNPRKLISWINENNIGLIHIVPSLFKLISSEIHDPQQFLHLKYILLAGELVRGNDIRKFINTFADRIQLVNLYGPTETTLAKFFYRIQSSDIEKPIIPVGKPIQGAEGLVLDGQGKKCLTGNIGEIYIRTPYISSGYFNSTDLTKQVFLKNHFSDNNNDILYKTGDMGRILFDGNLELTGRLDGQVKIRGHRVEMGEIENHLLNIENIKEAVVIDKEDKNGEKFLCAFFVKNKSKKQNSPQELEELKIQLTKNLPPYMIPTHFIPLNSMPLNPNGKINRDYLKQQDILVETGKMFTAPKDELEKKIAEIWKEVLTLDTIGINDNFFNVGGTSLHVIRVNSKINELLGIEIPIVKFFEFPTIDSYVKFLKGNFSITPQKKESHQIRMENMSRKRANMTIKKQKLKELRNA